MSANAGVVSVSRCDKWGRWQLGSPGFVIFQPWDYVNLKQPHHDAQNVDDRADSRAVRRSRRYTSSLVAEETLATPSMG